MTAGSNQNGKQSVDWAAIGAWIIDLVKALRGGPGRFYAYTFATGMIAITGAPWWAPFAEHLTGLILEYLTGEPASAADGITPEVSPWFIAISGLVICLFSMLGSYRVMTQNGFRAEKDEISQEEGSRDENALLEKAADLQSLLEAALQVTISATGTDYNQIFLVSTQSHSKQLVCVARRVASGKQDYRIAAFSGLLGKSVESGRVVSVPDTRERINYMQAVLETRSELVVPIKIEGRIVGLINSESETVGHYGNDHEKVLLRLAKAIGANLHRVGWHENMSPDALPWIGGGLRGTSLSRIRPDKAIDCPKCHQGFLVPVTDITKASEGTFTRHFSMKQCTNCREFVET